MRVNLSKRSKSSKPPMLVNSEKASVFLPDLELTLDLTKDTLCIKDVELGAHRMIQLVYLLNHPGAKVTSLSLINVMKGQNHLTPNGAEMFFAELSKVQKISSLTLYGCGITDSKTYMIMGKYLEMNSCLKKIDLEVPVDLDLTTPPDGNLNKAWPDQWFVEHTSFTMGPVVDVTLRFKNTVMMYFSLEHRKEFVNEAVRRLTLICESNDGGNCDISGDSYPNVDLDTGGFEPNEAVYGLLNVFDSYPNLIELNSHGFRYIPFADDTIEDTLQRMWAFEQGLCEHKSLVSINYPQAICALEKGQLAHPSVETLSEDLPIYPGSIERIKQHLQNNYNKMLYPNQAALTLLLERYRQSPATVINQLPRDITYKIISYLDQADDYTLSKPRLAHLNQFAKGLFERRNLNKPSTNLPQANYGAPGLFARQNFEQQGQNLPAPSICESDNNEDKRKANEAEDGIPALAPITKLPKLG